MYSNMGTYRYSSIKPSIQQSTGNVTTPQLF